MSVRSEITRISNNVNNALSAVQEMGGDVPSGANSDNLANSVRSIPVGAKINDNTVSTSMTYSSAKIEERFAAIGSQEDIVQQVIMALGTPVFGRVDGDNNIILTGSLGDGTYTVKYEDADGKSTVIGTIASAPPIVYEWVYGQPGRDSATSIVYYNAPGDGSTNYRMLYQTTGDAPYYTSATLATATTYYPLAVPTGKTKMILSFPNLATSHKLIMAVRALTLDGNAYKQVASSGWLSEGVYEWSFDAGTKFVAPYFRNNAYGGLNSYDMSGVTVSWE